MNHPAAAATLKSCVPANGRSTVTGPLEGILVADFSRVLAGPLASMTLSDLGARVIKVERPGHGDDTRAWGPPFTEHGATYFASVNRGKESITLDLGDPEDLRLARELALRADVLLENFTPGTMERFGLGFDQLRAANPGLVHCSITGFGTEAGARMLGYDFVVQAVGGLMSVTGQPDGEPTKVGVALVDVLTGKDVAAGVLAALFARERTGLGQRLEVSLLTSLLGALVNQGQATLATGTPPRAMGNQHPSIAPYETLQAADRPLAVACGNDLQFARLCGVLDRPELAEDPRYAHNPDRVAHRPELIADLEAVLRQRDAEDWVAELTAAGVPAGPVNDIDRAIELAGELGLAPTIELPDGHGRQLRHPVRWVGTELPDPCPPPALGEQDAAIRAWLQAPTDSPSVPTEEAR
ncbi:carnitine dehydratase [Enemella evansiae]|nr:carnitine dehydratase [Enemella evansiae]